MKSGISILLVEPENPDNIGSVARAMKNMGLSDLRVIRPPHDWKSAGKKLAVSAGDVLENAKDYSDLNEAVSDAALVIGTTRRRRRYQATFISYQEALNKIHTVQHARKKVVLMFGKESKGLDNESLQRCDWVTSIPASPLYPSINLAQAVMIFAFSLYNQSSGILPEMGSGGERVSKREEGEVLSAFEKALEVLNYSERSQLVPRILQTFHGLLKRNGLLKREAQMLKGISRRIREQVTRKSVSEGG